MNAISYIYYRIKKINPDYGNIAVPDVPQGIRDNRYQGSLNPIQFQ